MYKIKHFVILFSVILSLSCSLIGKPTEIVYLIPKGFTGGVIIFYNQPDGITPETIGDDKIIYHIPKDGVLKVKQTLKKAAYKFSYYFVDNQGNKTPVEYLYPRYYVRNPGDTISKSFDTITEDETENKTFAMIHTTFFFENSQGEPVAVYNFIVGKPKDYGILYLKASDKIDDIQMNKSKEKIQTQPDKE